MKVWLAVIILLGMSGVSRAADALYGQRIIAGSNTVAATELARWLTEMTGAPFAITNDAPTGLFLLHTNSPLVVASDRERLVEKGPEAFLIRAAGNSNLWIVGNSSLALDAGVYTYLEKLGCRWYFPHEAWRIIPRRSNIVLTAEILSKPDYESRRIFLAYGTRSKVADAALAEWNRWNRMSGSFRAQTGHAYPAIVNRNKAEFEKHPEYFAILANGGRDTNRVAAARKFCVSNEGLVQLCIADAFRQFETSPETMMISLDPSDGPGSCECDDCKKIGTVSDRVFHLANRVAKAVGEKYPGKWVGLYAYSSHLMPTSLKLEPNVYVMLATAFNSTPYTIDQLIELWGKRVTKLGIREYYGVMAWDFDMPGQPRGARIGYLGKSIPHFHSLGANAMTAESNIGWISRGLGHYVAAKLLWDVRADVPALCDDFYAKCFGAARPPMEELFQRWQRNRNPVPTSHDLAIWLRLTDDGARLATDDPTRARIEQIKYYLHYVALYHDYRNAIGDKVERTAYEDMLRYAWRVKDLGVCASYPLARRLANSKAPTPAHKFNNPKCVWCDETPVTSAELETLFRADLAKYQEIQGLKVVAYSNVFKPLDDRRGGVFAENAFRGPHEFIVRIGTEAATLRVASDFVYGRGYETTAKFYSIAEEIDDEADTPVYEQKLPGNLAFHEVNLATLKPGTYRLVLDDRRSGFKVVTDGLQLSIRADAANKVWTSNRSDFYFYVPPGTRKFVIVADGPMTVQKPKGGKQEFSAKQSLREVDVKEGEEGLWKILEQRGKFYFLGIPPYVALAPQQMLLPEIIK